MPKPNLKRLRILAEWLKKVPPERFDLGWWFIGPSPWGAPSLSLEDDDCGTTACAVGWGSACPALRRAGLTLNTRAVPSFEGETGFDAVERFFRLSEEQACHLFNDGDYPDRNRTRLPTVIKRIEAFIAKHEGA